MSKSDMILQILIIFFIFFSPRFLCADSIYFNDAHEGIECEFIEINEKKESVKIKISRDKFNSMKLNLSSKAEYPHTFNFKGIEREIKGKILELKEDFLFIKIPKEEVSSVKIDFSRDRGLKIRTDEEISGKKGQRASKESDVRKNEVKEQEIIKRLQERTERLEKNLEDHKKSRDSPIPGPSKNVAAVEQLLQQEMGRVKGVILWKGEPLANGRVMIVLERYTGLSFASFKKMFMADREGISDQKMTFETKTDSQGRYIFEKVPPGQYRLYWMPDAETGWVHRLRERPDFEVVSGKPIVQNIPETKQ